MTSEQKIELEYLIDLLREATKWSVDQGDDALRLEVDLRINNILSSVEVEGETEVQGEPDNLPAEEEPLTGTDYQALEAAKLNEHLESADQSPNKWAKQVKWRSDKVRCSENGRLVWHPRAECHKEKLFPDNPESKQFRWVWDGPQDKKAQEEQMWAEHEQSN